LMTAPEASAIAGASLVGEGSQPRGELRECEFLGGPASLFVELQQSSDPGAPMATYEAFESQLASPASHYRITQLPTVANGAFMAQADVEGTTAAGIYVIDGTSFFDIVCSTTPGCDAKELMAGEAFAAGRLSAATS
jgi:hypothetical protein